MAYTCIYVDIYMYIVRDNEEDELGDECSYMGSLCGRHSGICLYIGHYIYAKGKMESFAFGKQNYRWQTCVRLFVYRNYIIGGHHFSTCISAMDSFCLSLCICLSLFSFSLERGSSFGSSLYIYIYILKYLAVYVCVSTKNAKRNHNFRTLKHRTQY